MKMYNTTEYLRYLHLAEKFVIEAEFSYKNNALNDAMRHYYHAEMLFEQAKEIADSYLELKQKLVAQEGELYCLQKIDELEKFKNISKNDAVKC